MKNFDVVVIGGGVIGLSVAYHLREAGAGSVAIIERHSHPGTESSSRAAGGIRAQFGTPINIDFSKHSIEFFQRFHLETNGLVDLKQVGYLFMAGTEATEAALRQNYEIQVSRDVPTQWLDPDGVLELLPWVTPEGLRCGTFCDTDGIVDPHGVVSAYWNECRRLGVNFMFDTEVAGLTKRDDSLDVVTPDGMIGTAVVVNAAGSYARQISSLVGQDLPVEPVRRNLAVTEPFAGVPSVIPMCIDFDTGVLVRREGEGLLFAYSNPNDPPSYDTSFDEKFLYDLGERISNRFALLENASIDRRKCWAGLYPETPDHHAVIGRTEGLDSFIVCAGFGGHGVMHSPAAGKAVSELIDHGEAKTFDLHPLRPTRFEEGDLTIEPAVL